MRSCAPSCTRIFSITPRFRRPSSPLMPASSVLASRPPRFRKRTTAKSPTPTPSLLPTCSKRSAPAQPSTTSAERELAPPAPSFGLASRPKPSTTSWNSLPPTVGAPPSSMPSPPQVFRDSTLFSFRWAASSSHSPASTCTATIWHAPCSRPASKNFVGASSKILKFAKSRPAPRSRRRFSKHCRFTPNPFLCSTLCRHPAPPRYFLQAFLELLHLEGPRPQKLLDLLIDCRERIAFGLFLFRGFLGLWPSRATPDSIRQIGILPHTRGSAAITASVN